MRDLKRIIGQSNLYFKITSDKNIFYSIYSLESYVFEKELLESEDYDLLFGLRDRFNEELIAHTIKMVKMKLDDVLLSDKLFEASVYFRPKKAEKSKIEQQYIDKLDVISRPIHISDLYTQIAIATILNAILFEESNGKVELSELGRILPKNFYGNIPTENPKYLFEPWQKKYKEYSNIVSESYSRFLETKEYSNEIMIDLENFFPSVQPLIVYKKILEVLAVKYTGNELDCLKMAIFKLLYMKVRNCNNDMYYLLQKNSIYNLEIRYTQGIPQGLPQSYLFGNICMMDVANIFDEIFKGQAYYYVDDSVIYTNILKDEEDLIGKFNEKIKELNSRLDNINVEFKTIEDNLPNSKYIIDIPNLNEKLRYTIKAHELTGKSEISEINSEKMGNPNLSVLGKVASLSSFELATTFIDSEETTLKNKFMEFKKSIEAEIDRIDSLKEEKEEFKYYRKYLVRYKKFMKFRERLLIAREEDKISDEYIEQIIGKLCIEINEEGQLLYESVNNFFQEFSEDILITELFFILRKNYNQKTYKKLLKSINCLDKSIYGNKFSEYAYFSKAIKNLTVNKNLAMKNLDLYANLKKKIDLIYPEFENKQTKTRLGVVNSVIEELSVERREKFFSNIHVAFKSNGYFSWVNKGTDELYRQVLNVCISKIYGIYVSDNKKINRIGSKPILYNEFRMNIFLRNKNFNLDEFYIFAREIREELNNCVLDYSVIDIVDYYVSFVKRPLFVDNLIQIHKYTSEIWKNGSKFLHFYTLHNHEHAMELIKAAVKFLKNTDYFQISKTDYYILFIACYLHDISMVLHPDLIKIFAAKENLDSNIIVSDFRNELSKILDSNLYTIDSRILKDLLISYFRKIDQFFEINVRNRHAIDSSRFIRNTKDLGFLQRTIRDIVAEVSEAHCFDVLDIYDVKSNATESLVSRKYIKIILRIADLLDVSDNRVANAVLLNNNSYMNPATLFHWISHQAISGYEFETKYTNKYLTSATILERDKYKSYLSKGAIAEKITITFYLNFKHYIGVKEAMCKYCHSTESSQEIVKMVISEDDNEKCSLNSCNFICRWMVEKNQYLFKELFSLQRYLKRSSSNFFETKFEVKFQCKTNARFLKPEEYNAINNYIEQFCNI